MDGSPATPAAHRRFRLGAIAFAVALLLFGLIDVRRRAAVDPDSPRVHKTDLTIFTGAGAAFLADREPYQTANPRGWKYNYPPLFALLLAPLAPLHSQLQALIWFTLSGCFGGLAWREAVLISRDLGVDVRLTPRNQSPHRQLAFLAVAAVALPALNCLQRGQVGLLTLWLLLWGYRRLARASNGRHAFAAGILLALPGVLKVTPALPALAAVAAWGEARRRAGRPSLALAGWSGLLAGAALFLCLVPAAILGWNANLRHLQTWTRSVVGMAVEVDPASSLETPFTLRNQSLSNAAYRCGNWISYALFGGPDDRLVDAVPVPTDRPLLMESPRMERFVLAMRLVLTTLLAAAAWRAATLARPLDLAALFGLACTASLILSPMSRGHYFVLLLPASLWVPLWWNERRAGAGSAGLSLIPPGLVLAHYACLGVAGRAGLLGLGITVWFTIAATALLRCRSRQVDSSAAPDDSSRPLPSRAALPAPPRRAA